MTTGTLEARGSLRTAQFWPNGGSDADTVTIDLAPNGSAFRFRPAPDAPWQATHAFEGAVVKGAVRKAPISPTGRLTLRLLGIDAPELHCTATPRVKRSKQTPEQATLFLNWGRSYRQPFAESAILALRERLGDCVTALPCVARTSVDHPNEVFDCYGRMVSDLYVQTQNGELHVNRWLLEQGWAVPSLYDAMSAEEISAILTASRQAREEKRGIWANLAERVGELDWELRYRHLHVPARADVGVVLHPKLFRRLVTWAVNKRSRMGNGTFREYLHGVNERCVQLDESRSLGPSARTMRLSDWIGDDGRIVVDPGEMVLKEKESVLVGRDGVGVVGW